MQSPLAIRSPDRTTRYSRNIDSNDLVSSKGDPPYLIIDVFMVLLLVVTVTSQFRELSFPLSSPLGPPHPSYQRLALSRVAASHRRSYRRGKLGKTGSRTSRLHGSMRLPNSTEPAAEASWTSSSRSSR